MSFDFRFFFFFGRREGDRKRFVFFVSGSSTLIRSADYGKKKKMSGLSVLISFDVTIERAARKVHDSNIGLCTNMRNSSEFLAIMEFFAVRVLHACSDRRWTKTN